MMISNLVKIGTCSWKYPSWQRIVYSKSKGINYLQEYARQYETVEVDQWFWSLFGDTVVLPKASVVKEYAASVPTGFRFSIKVPNSITLTHQYNKQKNTPLIANPNFLSSRLMTQFLKSLEPLENHLGPLLFQFEYLNQKKMKGLPQFLALFETFRCNLPQGFKYCMEIRNPNYLTPRYFDYLNQHGLGAVFLQGYYMPSIYQVYPKFKTRLCDPVVIRLHGPNRKNMEEMTKGKWDKIVAPQDDELLQLAGMVRDLAARQHRVYINVNNHYEGSAPLTIEKIKSYLNAEI